MAVNRLYAEEIHDQFGYLATWLPNAPVRIGYVGTVERGIFTVIGTLKDFGITYSEEMHPERADLEYASAGAVSIDFTGVGDAPVAGNIPAKVEGDVGVSFNRANAILFQASRCRTITLSNLKHVSDQIISLFNAGTWPTNQVVVTDVIHSAALTVLISSGANAHITLTVKGELGPEKAKLASANASLKDKSSSFIGTKILSERDLMPLFKARGIRTPWLPWNDPTLVTRGGDTELKLDLLDHHQLREVGPRGELGG